MGHSVARVQKVQRIQRVKVDGPSGRGLWSPVGDGLCIASLRGRQRLCRWGWWWRPAGAIYRRLRRPLTFGDRISDV